MVASDATCYRLLAQLEIPMKTTATSNRDSALIGIFGLAFAVGYGMLGIDFGGVTLSSNEAWSKGVAQPYVAAGLLLAAFSVPLHQGATWVKWAIILWCPITLVGGMSWALSRGVGTFDIYEFVLIGFPISAIWFGSIFSMLFGRNSQKNAQTNSSVLAGLQLDPDVRLEASSKAAEAGELSHHRNRAEGCRHSGF